MGEKRLRGAGLFLCGAAVAAFGIGGSALNAEDKVFFMELPTRVLPVDVGANAAVVPANDRNGGGLYWMPTSGTVSIGGRSAAAVSRDGKTIVGDALDNRGFENAAIWTGGTTWRVLGSFTPAAQPCDALLSSSYGASDDGKVIVGLGWDGCRLAHAFRWEESTGMVDLGTTNGESTRANGISGDGKVVIGWQEDLTGFRMAAKWTGKTEELIKGPQSLLGEAHGTNTDGSIIVGGNCEPFTASANTSSAWVWTASTGVKCYPVDRPATLPRNFYEAIMFSTSNDGRVIGGSYTFGLDAESLIWLDGQVYFLKDYLRQNGYPDAFRDWVNSGFVTAVSPDGRTLVGYGAGRLNFQGFIVVLPERSSK